MQARNKARKQKQDVDLDQLLDGGEAGAYEALQLFRSRALRAKGKNDNLSALQTTVEGAIKLIRKGYISASWELCDQLLDFLNDLESDMADPSIRELVFAVDDCLVQMVEGIEEAPNDKGFFRMRRDFLKGAIKWSQAFGKMALGDTALHVRLGAAMWAVDYRGATYHYAAGEAPMALAQKIDDWFGPSEDANRKARKLQADRVCTTGVCQFLGLENIRDANELLVLYKKSQKNRGNALDTKLIVFCGQLCEVCRREATPLYKTLVNSIVSDLDGWEEGSNSAIVSTLLQGPIAIKFFGMQPKVHPMVQMMQQFLN